MVLECCKSCKLCSTKNAHAKQVQTCENSDDAHRDRNLCNDSSDESVED